MASRLDRLLEAEDSLRRPNSPFRAGIYRSWLEVRARVGQEGYFPSLRQELDALYADEPLYGVGRIASSAAAALSPLGLAAAYLFGC